MLHRITILFAGLVCGASLGVAAAPAITTVALTGQHAPGTELGVTFSNFFWNYEGVPEDDDSAALQLNQSGETAFWAQLAGPSIVPEVNDHGIWSDASGTLSLVARAGDPAPVPGYAVGFVSPLVSFSDAGHTAFLTRDSWFGFDGSALWAAPSDGPIRLVAADGQLAPGTSWTFEYFTRGAVNNLGQIAFDHSFVGRAGIWSEGGGVLALVAKAGDPAPGTEKTFYGFAYPDSFNGAGQTAFMATLDPYVIDDGIWFHDPGSGLTLVARTGYPAPDTDPPAILIAINYSPLLLNENGAMAFRGWTTDSGGVWAGSPGAIRLVALAGPEAPGTAPGVTFYRYGFDDPQINALGRTAFRALLTGAVSETDDSGIWSEGGGPLALVAREGDEAPDAGPGVDFSEFISAPRLNDHGQTAFYARLAGVGMNDSNDHGIWAEDGSGVLRLVVRAGDTIEVAAGDWRTVEFIAYSSYSHDHPIRFNNDGHIAFKARFTDGSEGLFIARLEADGDSDGVPDAEEQGPDGTDPDYDGDASGTPDREESNVASLHSHDGTEYLTLATPAGTNLVDVQAIAPPEPPPMGVELPVGLLAFHIDGLPIGGATTATIYLPAGVEPDSFWKYGPEPGDPVDHWYEFLFDGTTGAEIAANLITLHLVDGLRGDHDLVADGKVVEPGGPALTASLEVEVPLDIRPGACPNPLNVASRGVLPTAVAGHAGLDVTMIDIDSIRLEGIAPLRSAIRDVTTPFWPFIGKVDAADCTTERRDGLLDLTLSFNTQAVVAQVETRLGRPIENREVLVLHLTGNLTEAHGGNPIAGEDVVLALSRKR